jgi:hypothetical protein
VTAAGLWARTAAAYDRTVAAGARARLESTVGLIRNLAVTGGDGLETARRHRLAAIMAAEEFGDPELTARMIGAYDVPAIWTRADDPELARAIVAVAERTLAALPRGSSHDAARARLLATIALETRGSRSERGPQAAREAEAIARRLDDPALLAFALNAAFMQSCTRAGLALRRDGIGAELVELAARHGLVTFEVLGHLIRVQARCALADFATADEHAAAADRLSERHELPLVGVFTQWYAALRLAATDQAPPTSEQALAEPGQEPPASEQALAGPGQEPPASEQALAGSGRAPTASGQMVRAEVEAAYRAAAGRLDGAGMPGLEQGLLPLAVLSLRLAGGRPLVTVLCAGDGSPATVPCAGDGSPVTVPWADGWLPGVDPRTDWGPYRPWAEPFALLHAGRRAEAWAALRALPEPPADLMYEALCCLEAAVALELGDRPVLERAYARLLPAAGELAGAGSGLITLGPVDRWLAEIGAALRVPPKA